MLRLCAWLFGAMVLFVAGSSARAADSAAGNWKFTFPVQTRMGDANLNMLVMFSESEGKWVADLLDIAPSIGTDPTIDVTVKDELVKFTISIGPNKLTFDGRLQPGGKRIKGSIDLGGQIVLVELSPSKLKSLSKDRFAVARESLDNAETPTEFFNALFPVLAGAGEKKLKADDVRAYTDKAAKLAEPYGGRWQRTVAFRIAELLVDHEALAPVAVEQARQAERLLSRNDDLATQLYTLDTLARVLRRAKKDADAKEVDGRIAKLEPRDYAEYLRGAVGFKADEFKGRKAKSERAVLVEYFTSTTAGRSTATEAALVALNQTYKPAEVIVLHYYVNVPGPDPLSSRSSTARYDYYVKKEDLETPFTFVGGKRQGGAGAAQPKLVRLQYQSLCDLINDGLEKPAGVKLALSAGLKGDELSIKAVVSELDKPGEKISLRFAVVEDRVRYTGDNGIRYHHAVVRATPGGPKGFPMTKAAAEQTAAIKLSEIRTDYNKYLDEYTDQLRKSGAGNFSFDDRPCSLKNLRVVAFVQNDETGEVLHVVQADVDAGKE